MHFPPWLTRPFMNVWSISYQIYVMLHPFKLDTREANCVSVTILCYFWPWPFGISYALCMICILPSPNSMVSPVVMYGCESWTIKKAEHWRIDVFEMWCWRRLLRAPWTARRSNQSILVEISAEYHWKDWCWSWKSNTWVIWCKELTHWKSPWCWERPKAGGEEVDRGWDGWMAWTQTEWLDMTEQLDWTKMNWSRNSHSPQLCMWFSHIVLHFAEVFLKGLPQSVLTK